MRNLLLLAILTFYIYHVVRSVVIPIIPSGDDSSTHIGYCVYLNITKYLTIDKHNLQYPNVIHLLCGILARGNIFHGIILYKIYVVFIFLLPIVLITILLYRNPYYIVILLTTSTITFGGRYIQTLGDGEIFFISSFTFFTVALYMALKNKFTLFGIFLGLSLIHYYGIIFVLSFTPYFIYLLIRKRKELILTLLGFIIGFSPSFIKWIGLFQLIFGTSSPVSGYVEHVEENVIFWVNFSYTPNANYGVFIFSIYLMYSIISLIYSREKLAFVPLFYVVFTLLAPVLPFSPYIKYSVAYSELLLRLYRFLPLVTIILISITFYNNQKNILR